MKKHVLVITVCFILLIFASCEEEKEDFPVELLTCHSWNNPEIIRQTYGMVTIWTPIHFYTDGTAHFGSIEDISWKFIDSETILMSEKEWSIIELTDSVLHVNEYYFKENERKFGMEVKFTK